jgi:protein-S-isoprenylcysteine O-methyltransferase Ste14
MGYNFAMTVKASRWGVGPLFALLSCFYAVLLGISMLLLKLQFPMDLLPNSILIIIGVCLLLIGVPFLIIALISVHRAYSANKLITTGIFSLCRNPVYASWIVFFVPGIMLIRADWLGMTMPIFMYVILRLLIKKEEDYLVSVFGEEYIDYRKRVLCIMPFSWIKNRSKKSVRRWTMKKAFIVALENNKKILTCFVERMAEEEIDRRIKDYWTIYEHIDHLVSTQRMLFGRIEQFIKEESPVMKPYTPDNKPNAGEASVKELINMFYDIRDKQIKLIKKAKQKVWRKIGGHAEYSKYSFEILIRQMIFHDTYHFYRMEELWIEKEEYIKELK